jgi:glutamate racemase
VKATVNRGVGVIATVGTINSGAYSTAVRSLDAGVTVYSAATPRFVDVVEAGLRMDDSPLEDWISQTADVFIRPSFYQIARDYLNPLKRAGIDTLVLGCTHFPLLSAAIQQVVGPNVRIISSAEETARDVAETLSIRGQLALPGRGHRTFYTTGDPIEFERLGGRILGSATGVVGKVELTLLESLIDDSMRAQKDAFESEEDACS